MIIVYTKNSRLEFSSQSLSVCPILCTFFPFWGQQTLKWFFLLQFKHNFPYARHFPLGWEPLQGLHLMISFWFFIGSLVTWFAEIINFMSIGSWLGLEDLQGMFSNFLSSMSWTNSFQKGEIRFSHKSLMKGIVICAINNYIFNELV